MGPSTSSYLSKTAIFHFRDCGRKSMGLEKMEKLPNGAVCIKFMDTVFVISRIPYSNQRSFPILGGFWVSIAKYKWWG